MKTTLAICATLAMAMPGLSQAQGTSIGEREFQNSCAQCHGATGIGDGHLVEYLIDLGSLDLTGLQKSNGGVFPVSRVYNVIEGNAMGAHGDRLMPIWGDRYRERSAADQAEMNALLSPEQERTLIRTRVLALTEYIASIQAQ